METELARHVVRAAFRSARQLEGILGVLKEHCGAVEYDIYAKAIAAAIDSIHREVVDRITLSHPELEQEIGSNMAKYGKYL